MPTDWADQKAREFVAKEIPRHWQPPWGDGGLWTEEAHALVDYIAAALREAAGEWVSVEDRLPELDATTECAAISGYDGSAFRLFAFRQEDGDGWYWVYADDLELSFSPGDPVDFEIFAWRNPAPLPDPPTPSRAAADPSGPDPE